MPSFKFHVIFLLMALFVITSTVMADVPQVINYQGRLTDSSGVPVNMTVSITFTIYDNSTGGESKWTETQSSVVVTDGFFNVLLGSVNNIPDTVFNGSDRWLGIKVDSDPEIAPRTRITSVGYAYPALRADTATVALSSGVGGWVDDGSVVRLTNPSDSIYIGSGVGGVPTEKVFVNGNIAVFSDNLINNAIIWRSDVPEQTKTAAKIEAIGHGSWIRKGLAFYTNNNYDLTTPPSERMRITESGNVGIGTTDPTTKLQVDGVIGVGGPVDVGDLSYLVAYLFQGGPKPPCTEEGNVDSVIGVGGPIDVADLSYLVGFLFQGGSPPPSC